MIGIAITLTAIAVASISTYYRHKKWKKEQARLKRLRNKTNTMRREL